MLNLNAVNESVTKMQAAVSLQLEQEQAVARTPFAFTVFALFLLLLASVSGNKAKANEYRFHDWEESAPTAEERIAQEQARIQKRAAEDRQRREARTKRHEEWRAKESETYGKDPVAKEMIDLNVAPAYDKVVRRYAAKSRFANA